MLAGQFDRQGHAPGRTGRVFNMYQDVLERHLLAFSANARNVPN
jgi:hypothetical protein